MKEYDHKKIEKKWQTIWEKSGIYHAKDDSKNKSKKQKFYGLIEFPYPSGSWLHVGHIRSNTAMDIISRKRRMEGYNVLYPIGWDAFGLPTENYADGLEKDLDTVDYLEKIKIQQRNWIGKSEGINLKFKVKDVDIYFEAYDSVPQTFMAQTFTVIAPDHPMLGKLVEGTPREKDVLSCAKKMISERQKMGENYTKEIDGIFTDRYVWY